MVIEKDEVLVSIAVRVSPKTREQARELARENGVKESKVYRSILDDFFCRDRQLSVDEKETESMKNE